MGPLPSNPNGIPYTDNLNDWIPVGDYNRYLKDRTEYLRSLLSQE